MNKPKTNPRRRQLDKILMEYLGVFLNKYEMNLEFIINNDTLYGFCISDDFFETSEIVYAVDNDVPARIIDEWLRPETKRGYKNLKVFYEFKKRQDERNN